MADRAKITGIILAVLGAILVIATTALAYAYAASGTAATAHTGTQVNASRIGDIKEDLNDIKTEQRALRKDMGDKLEVILRKLPD